MTEGEALSREDLADAIWSVGGIWGLGYGGGPPNLRWPEEHIEIMAHELAHSLDLGITKTGHASREISDRLQTLPAVEQNEREFRTLAIEVLGLHKLGYKIRLLTLAKWVELKQPCGYESIIEMRSEKINPKRTVKYIMKRVQAHMEEVGTKDLVDKFVREVHEEYATMTTASSTN